MGEAGGCTYSPARSRPPTDKSPADHNTERRRNRTFQRWGCQGLPVLKCRVCRAFALVWACFCSASCGQVRSDSPSSGHGGGHASRCSIAGLLPTMSRPNTARPGVSAGGRPAPAPEVAAARGSATPSTTSRAFRIRGAGLSLRPAGASVRHPRVQQLARRPYQESDRCLSCSRHRGLGSSLAPRRSPVPTGLCPASSGRERP
jgi:hypothetical protein